MTHPTMSRHARTRAQVHIVTHRRLIAELSRRNLSRYEVAANLGIGKGAVNFYLRELESAGIIITDGPRYRLVADAAAVERFLATVDRTRPKREKTLVSRAALMAAKDRHFYVMDDDAPFLPKLHRGPAAPDPFALPVGFFGSARAVEVRA